MRNSRGFTLIELMIVVAIIGILSMFALPAYQDYMRKTQVAEVISASAGIRSVLIEQYSVEGTFENAFLSSMVGSGTLIELGHNVTVEVQGDKAVLGGFSHVINIEVGLGDSDLLYDFSKAGGLNSAQMSEINANAAKIPLMAKGSMFISLIINLIHMLMLVVTQK